MKKLIALFYIGLLSCDTGNLRIVTDLPHTLNEASGIEKVANSNLLWMINDSGNKPVLFGIDTLGNIQKQLKIKAKNHDWEELTSDQAGNIYIGDFGNNANKRKNLRILIVKHNSLTSSKDVDVEKIEFSYPNQKKFPPKNKKMQFDCEAFFHYNDSLFLLTKSRSKNQFGQTNLYKIPAKKGHHQAEYVTSFNTCNEHGCWITSADMNSIHNKIVILAENSAWVFSDFKANNFFDGKVQSYFFDFKSQKESVLFKNDSTLWITDERSNGKGGNLYELKLKP